MAATIGAGVQDGEFFKAMAEHNVIAVGGTNMVSPSSKQLRNVVDKMKRGISVSSAGPLVADMD